MSTRVKIIAEAGVNHNGDIELAKKLIDVAASANVDYVKFQTFKADTIVSREVTMAEYQKRNTKSEKSQYELLKKLELTHDQHELLIDYATSKGTSFFSTAFDVDGLEYLYSLGFEMFKSPSGEITNYPYLQKLAHLGKPVILSTGMANLDEIKDALEVLTSKQLTLDDITVLHCNTEYPTPFDDVNLKAMKTIADECKVKIGYSDHTLGIEVPIAAVALGATVIEKHFTMSREMDGPDHAASLEPNELIAMVKAIRNIEMATSGAGKKEPSNSERKNLVIARKSIHLSRHLKKGETIDEYDILPLRPGDGISPMQWKKIIGRKVKLDLSRFHKLSPEDLQ
ncbi:MAG: N-acetylneuraminate synthase [Fulvivirga sp.]|uniref:N-acetylneuraminate synthase n=1 Tax=Fulvivirga sp. TaxID=1931237 RepID=UPI0032EE0669